MKTRLFILFAIFSLAIVAGCDKETDEPQRDYPEGSIVWGKDSVVVLTDHFIVPLNKSLYIEEGVKVIFSAPEKGPEVIVLGNLYSYGTKENPVMFTVPEADRTEANRFAGLWGGIICGYDSEEVLLQYTIIEYASAKTTEESASFQYQLFKTATGEGVPGFHFCNIDGKFVIDNCIFRNNAEDHIYITGGKSIIMNSVFYHSGFDGGEAINYKSDCITDLAFNLIYDANTNAFKLSNNGLQYTQSHIFVYNNTIINTGWRRPKVKGGSVWLETNIRAEVFNNLFFNNRHATKRDTKDPEDNRCVITPNFLFASTDAALEQIKHNEATGVLIGANDKVSATAGGNNPSFHNFSIQSEVDVMCGISKSGNVPQTFNTSWDFHLKAGSPALTGGNTSIKPHYNTTGLVIDNVEYKSPAPASYFGAYGLK